MQEENVRFRVLGGALVILGLVGCFASFDVLADETCMSPYMAKITSQEDFIYVWTLGAEGVGDEPATAPQSTPLPSVIEISIWPPPMETAKSISGGKRRGCTSINIHGFHWSASASVRTLNSVRMPTAFRRWPRLPRATTTSASSRSIRLPTATARMTNARPAEAEVGRHGEDGNYSDHL